MSRSAFKLRACLRREAIAHKIPSLLARLHIPAPPILPFMALTGRNSAGKKVSLLNDPTLKSRACERCRERHERCSPGSSHLICLGCEVASIACRGYRPPTCEECYRNKKKCVYDGEGSCRACVDNMCPCIARNRFNAEAKDAIVDDG